MSTNKILIFYFISATWFIITSVLGGETWLFRVSNKVQLSYASITDLIQSSTVLIQNPLTNNLLAVLVFHRTFVEFIQWLEASLSPRALYRPQYYAWFRSFQNALLSVPLFHRHQFNGIQSRLETSPKRLHHTV